MNRALRHARDAGLISAGGVAQSFLVRLSPLLARIGLVKAASLRVARRIARTLHAGVAVDSYAGLDSCRVIFIAVPDSLLQATARDLAREVPLAGKIIVVCGSDFASAALEPLRDARTASLNALDPAARTLILEGEDCAVREIAAIFKGARAHRPKLITIHSKPRYLAGVRFATDSIRPWIDAALESFRAAGFSRSDAAATVETLGYRTLRACVRTGNKPATPAP